MNNAKIKIYGVCNRLLYKVATEMYRIRKRIFEERFLISDKKWQRQKR